jgi:hypothetical protein
MERLILYKGNAFVRLKSTKQDFVVLSPSSATRRPRLYSLDKKKFGALHIKNNFYHSHITWITVSLECHLFMYNITELDIERQS